MTRIILMIYPYLPPEDEPVSGYKPYLSIRYSLVQYVVQYYLVVVMLLLRTAGCMTLHVAWIRGF
jgi:hypothetical protein